jgi:hypothetical protein
MSKILRGQDPDTHSKEKGGKEGRGRETRRGRGREGRGASPNKIYDYSTEADELSLVIANLHLELELCGNRKIENGKSNCG